jgi:uncharacterized protein with von Willebrand factor type A (vWA) domain
MMNTDQRNNEALKQEWTDQYVEVVAEHPELKRFAGQIGRVITVNQNNKALVEFASADGKESEDGGWYDITASDEYLRKLDPETAKAKWTGSPNSAKPRPGKQG